MSIINGVSGLAHQDGMILMGKRKPTQLRPELWELPGGKVEPAELFVNAMAREWEEELGFKIIVGERIATESLDLVEQRYVLHLYEVVPHSGRFPLAPKPIEHTELRWVDHPTAMRSLPCSPVYYLHYSHIHRWIMNH